MLIPTTYESPDVLAELAGILRLRQPNFFWPDRNHYKIEYSWTLDRLNEHLGHSGRVMDAGGAASPIQHYLAARHTEVYNASHAPGLVHASLERDNLHRLAGDLGTMDLPDDLDAIVSASSIEHNEWGKLLRIVRRLVASLRTGGVLICTVPALKKRKWYPRGGWPEPHQKPWGQTYLFDSTALRRLVEEAQCESGAPVLLTPEPQHWRAYQAEWQRMRDDLDAAPASCNRAKRLPYLSMGFVLRRSA